MDQTKVPAAMGGLPMEKGGTAPDALIVVQLIWRKVESPLLVPLLVLSVGLSVLGLVVAVAGGTECDSLVEIIESTPRI